MFSKIESQTLQLFDGNWRGLKFFTKTQKGDTNMEQCFLCNKNIEKIHPSAKMRPYYAFFDESTSAPTPKLIITPTNPSAGKRCHKRCFLETITNIIKKQIFATPLCHQNYKDVRVIVKMYLGQYYASKVHN